jgi:hypothetical protein
MQQGSAALIDDDEAFWQCIRVAIMRAPNSTWQTSGLQVLFAW